METIKELVEKMSRTHIDTTECDKYTYYDWYKDVINVKKYIHFFPEEYNGIIQIFCMDWGIVPDWYLQGISERIDLFLPGILRVSL